MLAATMDNKKDSMTLFGLKIHTPKCPTTAPSQLLDPFQRGASPAITLFFHLLSPHKTHPTTATVSQCQSNIHRYRYTSSAFQPSNIWIIRIFSLAAVKRLSFRRICLPVRIMCVSLFKIVYPSTQVIWTHNYSIAFLKKINLCFCFLESAGIVCPTISALGLIDSKEGLHRTAIVISMVKFV